MISTGFFIGIDIGTSGSKAVLIDDRGVIQYEAELDYPLSTPRPGWNEQDPADWWNRSAEVLSSLTEIARSRGAEVRGVGLTGQMHSSVFLDKNDRVIRPALLWNDTRTEAECREIEERVGGVSRLIRLTSNLALEGFTATKVLWLRNHEPEHYQRLRHLLVAKDYIRLQLTGERATEVSDASGTLLFDVGRRAWSTEILETLDLEPEIMPRCFESPEVTGHVSEAASKRTGLSAGTPVIGGGGDQAAGAVGNGVVRPGQICISLGTSGVVFSPTAEHRPEPEGRIHTFCHTVPGRWHAMGVMLSAAGAYQWFHDQLGGGDSFEELNKKAESVLPGAGGVLFLPYLSGERTPHNDPHARGLFTGLSLSSGRGEMARAVIEGVSYGLHDCLELIRGAGIEWDQALISGGGARSDLWCQITADVLGITISRLQENPGPAYGAALLASVGSGVYSSVDEACEGHGQVERVFEPRKEYQNIYHEGYQRYRELYRRMREFFRETAKST
ncbi:MAG: xylulokinase [Deltaproteobacteria bacterium]|nr:MAG: xylulokinase [Deltaproteobacteria bacterium]